MIPSTRKRISRLALACSALLIGVSGCVGTEGTPQGAPPPSTTPSTPVSSPKPTATATADACPPDVNLMFEWLKATPAIMDQLPGGVTGLEEPKCFQNWSMSRIVVKNADPSLILFKLEPTTGKWIPVAAGTDNICDAQQVPADVQAKLGPGC